MKQRILFLLSVFLMVALACNIPSQAPDQEIEEPSNPPFIRSPGPAGSIYYVRSDGGSYEQCTGLVDASYPGSGINQPCAWDHPFQALPPGGTPRILGGDTVIIEAGSYMMGFGGPGAVAPGPPHHPPVCHRRRLAGL